MSVRFLTKVAWPANDLLFPAESFGATVPRGLDMWHVRSPKFVEPLEMQRLLRSRSNVSASAQMASVNGLVTRNITASLASHSQIAVVREGNGPPAKTGPLWFRFTGGDVLITLELGIYVAKHMAWAGSADPLQTRIFAEVYSHELLHVLDETRLLDATLPSKLRDDDWIAENLVRCQKQQYGRGRDSAAQVEQDYRAYFLENLQTAVFNVWAAESNRLDGIRDAPAEYKKVRDRISDLQTQRINGPIPVTGSMRARP